VSSVLSLPKETMMRRFITAAAVLLAAGTHSTLYAGDVILQYYESKWETIEKKLPDVFVTGYSAFWFPPPSKADSGGYSVGYDVFDRFNLGKPFDQTLYGTENSVKQMVRTTHRAGMKSYFDFVPNHNGFRDSSSSGFAAAGDYPGFVTTLPGDVDGDFHGAYEGGDLNGRISGLIDIAHEKNHQFIRHPVASNAQNIPNEPVTAANRRFYPDNSLPANSLGFHPFNTADETAGDAYSENATGLLMRNAQWMLEVIGADGFRLDAVKHSPSWFFSSFYDPIVYQRGRPNLDGSPSTPFSFGEAFDGDFGLLGQYRRKDGFGNREVLDFPLFFKMSSIFNAGGFGNMAELENASVDAIDGNANDGTAGVMFVNSHDEHGPALDNVAYAHILTRTGLPIVYFNAQEFGTNRDFPKGGRGDALGGDFGTVIPKLVDASRRYAKGGYIERWADGDTYVYERDNSLLVGLNDRGDSGYDTRNVQTNFRNVTLVELSGAATDPVVNANGDFPQTIAVGNDGMVSLRVPRNSTSGNHHGRGYVLYGPAVPAHDHTLTPVASVLAAESNAVQNGTRRHTPINVVNANTFAVNVQSAGAILEDNALVRLDGGTPIDANLGLAITTGEFAGFENFTGSASPREGGGTGNYSLNIDATSLPEGMHFLETVAFLKRTAGAPAAYSSHRSAFYLDRLPPAVSLAFPTTTGSNDIVSQSFGVVVKSTDLTADSMHIFFDQADGYDFLGNATAGNKMSRVDRDEFRFTWNSITPGTHKISVLAFEQTGNYSITHYNNIQAVVPQPEMQFGVDTNTANNAVNFQPAPSQITSSAYANEFVIRVKTSGGLSFPTHYTVSLEVDGTVYDAVGYNASLLPPTNRLVQNDQNLGDEWDEFRFLWRGYGHNDHNFVARAVLTDNSAPTNSIQHLVNVPTSVAGPAVVITSPSGNPTYNAPANLTVNTVAAFTARSIQVFLSKPGNVGPYSLFTTLNEPPSSSASHSRSISNYLATDVLGGFQLENGVYGIRAVAATGLNGSGLTGEAYTTISVTGFPTSPAAAVTAPVVDGHAGEFLGGVPAPLAVSAADGAGNSPVTADFGADGSLTELHGRVANGVLYLAVRGDIFNGDPNQNATILYLDVDAGAGTGAKNFATAQDLSDTGDANRTRVRTSGFQLSSGLASQGIGFDAAVILNGTSPVSYNVYGFGTGGVGGSAAAFLDLNAPSVAYWRGLGSIPGATGTTIAGPSSFEVAIPLNLLGNANPRNMVFAVVTTSDGGFPSPNTLPENTQNTFDAVQTLDAVARFPNPTLRLTEVANGNADWVEFLNTGAQPISLTSWTLTWSDTAGASNAYLLGTQSVPPTGYAVAAEGAVTPTPAGGALQVALSHNLPWHEGRGGAVALVDPYGLAADFVRWSSSAGVENTQAPGVGTAFTGSAAGFDSSVSGNALSRATVTTDTDAATDWAVRLATPGAETASTAGIGEWVLY